MQPHSQRGSKWRRFTHKYGVWIFVGICAVVIVGLVIFLMYVLTSMNWRARY